MRRLGIDAGSIYLGSVILENDAVVETFYLEHKGNIENTIQELFSKSQKRFDTIGVTGDFFQHYAFDNVLSVIEGAHFLLPKCKNIFTIGGENFSIIFFDEKGKYREHSLNPPCASGTGSFIEQQAQRLDISVEELSHKALQYRGTPPSIATRCAVFAKTDIIHAMQEGYSLEAICAGLCEGIASSVLDSLVKGREITSPVGIVGGVSRNTKIVNAMSDILRKEIAVPQYGYLAGAIGAALLGKETSFDFDMLKKEQGKREIRAPLKMELSQYPNFEALEFSNKNGVEVLLPKEHIESRDIYIGIDIGSTSTKAIIINKNKEVLGGFILRQVENQLRQLKSSLQA